MSCRLLELPAELRNSIYEFAFAPDTPAPTLEKFRDPDDGPPSDEEDDYPSSSDEELIPGEVTSSSLDVAVKDQRGPQIGLLLVCRQVNNEAQSAYDNALKSFKYRYCIRDCHDSAGEDEASRKAWAKRHAGPLNLPRARSLRVHLDMGQCSIFVHFEYARKKGQVRSPTHCNTSSRVRNRLLTYVFQHRFISKSAKTTVLDLFSTWRV